MPIVALQDIGDPRIADYRTLSDPDALRARGLFIAEGRLVVRRLLTAPALVTRSVLVTAPALATLGDAVEGRSDISVYVVAQDALNDIAGFNIHRGCLAIGERPGETAVAGWLAAQAPRSRVLVLEGVTNADNVGGIFRCAAAFGAGGVVLGRGCVDPLYRKAIRTSMGAALHVPFAIDDQWPSSLGVLRGDGFTLAALTPAPGAIDLDRAATTLRSKDRLALLLGAEFEGLSPAAQEHAAIRVRIPIDPCVDSLNVAVAAGIALHALRLR
jgi:tRNA G18 (ribose-2'-O)-methylase SpoU